jgi:hypothetical protein
MLLKLLELVLRSVDLLQLMLRYQLYEDEITAVEWKLSADVRIIGWSAEATQSNARLALIVSVVDLLPISTINSSSNNIH